MKKYFYKLSIIFALIAVSSCSKDFLEVPPTGKMSSDNYLKTDEQVRTALIGVYDIIQYNYSNGGWTSVYFIKNLPADDCNAAGGGPTDQQEYQYLDDYLISSDNSKLASIWTNFYKTINACNTIINHVADNADASAEMKVYANEAKALRAMTYFDLVVMFGGVPLFTVNPSDPAEFSMPRASKEDVYAQIEKDLKEAIDEVPLKSELSAGDKFRFSKGAAQGLLGKAYVYEKKYTEAIAVLSAVISSNEFSLEPNFGDVWRSSNKFGVESLFEVSYVASEAYDWGNFPWGGGNESNIEAQLEGPRDVIFDLSKCTLGVINGWGFNLPTKKIGDLFVSEGETDRYDGTLISQADFEVAGGVIKDLNGHDYEGYMRLKYVTRLTETGSVGVPELNYKINWRILRYADVLLLAAEAYNQAGQDANALVELNKVRARAKMAPRAFSGTALYADIKTERELELAFEGSRYWDLIRWGDAAAQMNAQGFVAGKHELFPIPLNEVIANTKISEADQNPGY